ncbi:MAG: hypothetical protein P1U68_14550 [Verrucomicrobiales bacterium]|nr:hypothetical protein [Verrucomicrobiales bacterium]
MNYLFIFKRFEIWLFLGVVIALLIFAFQPVEEEAVADRVEEAEAVNTLQLEEVVSEAATEEDSSALKVSKVKVEPTEQGQIVELTLLARSKTDQDLALDGKTLQARTETGAEVPRFFEPFQPPQTVGSEEESLVTVKLWLSSPAESIWLDFQGERVEAELPEES